MVLNQQMNAAFGINAPLLPQALAMTFSPQFLLPPFTAHATGPLEALPRSEADGDDAMEGLDSTKGESGAQVFALSQIRGVGLLSNDATLNTSGKYLPTD